MAMPTHAFMIPGSTYIQDAASTQDSDRIISWSTGLTIEEYRRRLNCELAVCIPWDEAVKAADANTRAKYCTGPKRITVERYEEQLGVLPPGKWTHSEGAASFYLNEHVSGTLVHWFVGCDGEHFTLVEDESLTHAQVVALCRPQRALGPTFKDAPPCTHCARCGRAVGDLPAGSCAGDGGEHPPESCACQASDAPAAPPAPAP